MNYYNEKTYSRDYETVAKFTEGGSGNGSSRCLDACNSLSKVLPDGNREAIDRACGILEEYLGISRETAIILAILVKNGGYVQSAGRMASLCGMEPERVEAVLREMSLSGYINQLKGANGIILSERAITILRGDDTLENLMAKEFVDILGQDAEEEDPYDEATLSMIAGQLNNYISKYPDSRMGRFYEENRMSALSGDEFRQFVYLCRSFVLSFTAGFRADRRRQAVRTMINRGWAVLFAAQGDNESELIKQNNMLLSVGVCRRLFAGMENLIDFTSIMGQTRFTRWGDIVEKELFYNDEDMEGIRSLYRMTREDEYRRIARKLKEHRLKVAVSAILYGSPGTGKTELARQIARTTQRNLLIVDASKLTGSYVGESERNFRDLFRNFRYIEAVSNRAPILFMDEADGILGKRITGADDSRSRYVNSIQNIILEELNDFEGILLATTNLADNLDEATDRRFLKKIEFHVPNEKTRLKIWKAKLPRVSEEDLAVIARDFPFAGGNIDNIAIQALIEGVIDGSDTVTLESLIKYSKNESSFRNKKDWKRIGF